MPIRSSIRALFLALSAVLVATVALAQPAPFPAPPPINPTHFHCYNVLGNPVPRRVILRDQFQAAPMVFVGKPTLLCAPVQKNGEETRDMKTHLVCYTIEGAHPANTNVRIDNQFGTQTMRVANSQLLCVPSRKTVLGPSWALTPLTPQKPCLSSPPPVPGVRYGTRDLALGANVAPATPAEILLLVNSYQTAAAQIRFGNSGPTSDVFEVCISSPSKTSVPLGGVNVTWVVEDPNDPGKVTPWATQIFSPMATALAGTPGPLVGGHEVIRVVITATQLKQALIHLNQIFPGYPSGRSMMTIIVGGQTFRLHVTVGQQ